jgi:hypothetical protein
MALRRFLHLQRLGGLVRRAGWVVRMSRLTWERGGCHGGCLSYGFEKLSRNLEIEGVFGVFYVAVVDIGRIQRDRLGI